MTTSNNDSDNLTTTAGVVMPKLIYGTAWKKERTEELVVKAVQIGFRGIDTACQPKHYEEPLVGAALQKLQTLGFKRENLFLQTKFTPLSGQDPDRIPYDPNAPLESQVEQSFAASKHNLHTDYVDSLVLHSPLSPHRDLLTVWRALEAIYASDGARQLGISNCYDLDCLQRLYDDAVVKPAVVQNRFYQNTGYDIPLRRWCNEQGIIYQSFWTLTANPHLLDSEALQTLARQYGKTAAQILFRYLSLTGVAPLTGTCSEQHMQEDLASFDIELTEDEIATIDYLLV